MNLITTDYNRLNDKLQLITIWERRRRPDAIELTSTVENVENAPRQAGVTEM